MGQKVHPYGLRLGINKPWKSRWFVERGYDKLLVEDVKLKAELREKLNVFDAMSAWRQQGGDVVISVPALDDGEVSFAGAYTFRLEGAQ